jgi:hypothetical protein
MSRLGARYLMAWGARVKREGAKYRRMHSNRAQNRASAWNAVAESWYRAEIRVFTIVSPSFSSAFHGNLPLQARPSQGRSGATLVTSV